MPTNEERLATLEQAKRDDDRFRRDMYDYMSEGRRWRDDTSTALAVITTKQIAMDAYQIHCDADRDNLTRDDASLSQRITELEGYKRRQIRVASWAGGIVALLVTGSPKVFTAIREIFQ